MEFEDAVELMVNLINKSITMNDQKKIIWRVNDVCIVYAKNESGLKKWYHGVIRDVINDETKREYKIKLLDTDATARSLSTRFLRQFTHLH